MANNTIKVSEVSELLRMQLEGIDTDVKFDETGTVISVSDGVVRIFGLRNAESNELLEFDNGMQAIVMNLEERSEEHTSELQSRENLVCRLLLEKKKK